MLVVVAFSLVSIVSPAHSKTLSTTDQAAADSTLESLEAQAAAAGIGVHTVNGTQVFHARNGQDLEIVKICDGSDGVRYGPETLTLSSALVRELSPQTGTKLPGDLTLPVHSNKQSVMVQPLTMLNNPVCYAQNDVQWGSLPLGNGRVNRPTIGLEGCYVTSSAMETATYGIGLYNYLADPESLNTWLNNNGGFRWSTDDQAYNDIVYEKMALVPGMSGVWQSFQNFTSIDMVYLCAQSFIAGSSSVKPSLPIAHMSKPGVPNHYVAWYSTDGSDTDANNLIIQPTLTNFSDTSLKCSFVCGAGNKNYSPVKDEYLMRVAYQLK
jgi:hypothetical protein